MLGLKPATLDLDTEIFVLFLSPVFSYRNGHPLDSPPSAVKWQRFCRDSVEILSLPLTDVCEDLQMSMHCPNVSLLVCRSFFRAELSLMPNTILSQISESVNDP